MHGAFVIVTALIRSVSVYGIKALPLGELDGEVRARLRGRIRTSDKEPGSGVPVAPFPPPKRSTPFPKCGLEGYPGESGFGVREHDTQRLPWAALW